MKQYMLAFKEIVEDFLFIVFFVTDFIAIILGLTGVTSLKPPFYIGLLLVGIFVSSLRLIVQKNKQIEKSEEISKRLKSQIEKTRPYIRFAWVTTQAGNNRRAQGITDTCIVVSNNGNSLMRRVQYNIEVDGKKIGVRNHDIIVPGNSTNLVYDDSKNKAGLALGCRNDNDFNDKNNKIIKESKIKISGSYRDVDGGKYIFSYETDINEQSWFKEIYRQKKIN